MPERKTMKIVVWIAAVVLVAAPGRAATVNCTLDQYEVHDPNANGVRLEKIKSTDGKEIAT